MLVCNRHEAERIKQLTAKVVRRTPMSVPAVPRAMGIDLGEARVGVAMADTLGMLAHPRETIRRAVAKGAAADKAVLARIAEIAPRKTSGHRARPAQEHGRHAKARPPPKPARLPTACGRRRPARSACSTNA